MKKINKKPTTLVYPVPAALVSCGSKPKEFNIISIAWTGTINSDPPMCYVSVRKNRYSYDIIKRNMEFVINYPTKDLVYEVDFCGRHSGKDINKFEKLNLTPVKGQNISSVIINESPVNIECKVTEIKELGSHDMFLAEIVNIQVSEDYVDRDTNAIRLINSELIAYSHGKYIQLGEILAQAGFSLKNQK